MNFIAALDECHKGKTMFTVVTQEGDYRTEMRIAEGLLYFKNSSTREEWLDATNKPIPAGLFAAKWYEVYPEGSVDDGGPCVDLSEES